MAYTSSIDELNNLQTEQDKQKIRKYFEEMELEPEEIEKRINTANGIDNLYLMLFLLMTASATAGESVVEQDAYWNDYLTRGYNDVLGENGYDTSDPMISNRIDETVAEVLTTTYEHIALGYYTSHDRAVMIASNDTNAFANYERHIRKIKEGYTRKRWITKVDKKTRHDHVWADGQETDIQKPFIVGGYEMLFPLDQSLGADAKEVVNCRCACDYFGKDVERIKPSTSKGYPVTQEQIDDILANELKDFNFPVKPVANNRIKDHGVSKAQELPYGKVVMQNIYIGKQKRNTRESLMDTLLHEYYESDIMLKKQYDDFYKELFNQGDKEIHAYINGKIKKFFEDNGFDYGLV